MIELKDVTKEYSKGISALNGINLKIEQGEFVFIVGDSGSGKSTLIKLIMKELEPTSGTIIVNGHNLGRMRHRKVPMYRRNIGVVFQDFRLLKDRNIYENIAFALRQRGMNKKQDLDEIVERSLRQAAMWDQVKDDLNKSALALSGGQQQRLCIARAIAIKPDILLLDEPASALDPVSTSQIEDTLLELKQNYTIIIVTHNMQQASRISDYTAFFNLGKVLEYSETGEIFTNPQVDLTNDYISGNFG